MIKIFDNLLKIYNFYFTSNKVDFITVNKLSLKTWNQCWAGWTFKYTIYVITYLLIKKPCKQDRFLFKRNIIRTLHRLKWQITWSGKACQITEILATPPFFHASDTTKVSGTRKNRWTFSIEMSRWDLFFSFDIRSLTNGFVLNIFQMSHVLHATVCDLALDPSLGLTDDNTSGWHIQA